MKILLSIHHSLHPQGGAAGTTLQLASQYKDLGHEVCVASFSNLPNWLPERVKIVIFPIYLALKLARGADRFDVLDLSSGDGWVWLLTKRSRAPLVVMRSHGLEHVADAQERREASDAQRKLSWRYELFHGGLRLWQVNQTLQRSDLVLVLNDGDLEYAIGPLGVSSERVRVIGNGVAESFLITPPHFTTAPHLGFIGTYLGRKGVKYMARAVASIMTRNDDVVFSLFGTSVPESQVLADYPPEVQARIKITRSYDHSQLPKLLDPVAILIFPSLSEGFSLALLEGMARGLAPVASSIPANLSIISAGRTGVIVPPRDWEALRDAINGLLRDHVGLSHLQREARALAEERSWKAVAAQSLEIYRCAMAEIV